MRCRISRSRSPHPSGRTCNRGECRTELAQVCVTLLGGLAVEQQPLPDGARDRFCRGLPPRR